MKHASDLLIRHFLHYLTYIMVKSRSNKKKRNICKEALETGKIKIPVEMLCILSKCTHSEIFVKIGPTVRELWHFLYFHVRPPGSQVVNRIRPKFGVQGHLF